MVGLQSCGVCGARLGIRDSWRSAVDDTEHVHSFLTLNGTVRETATRWICGRCRSRAARDARSSKPASVLAGPREIDAAFMGVPRASDRPPDSEPYTSRRRDPPVPDWSDQLSTAVSSFSEILALREQRIRELEQMQSRTVDRVKDVTSRRGREIRHLRATVSRLEHSLSHRNRELELLRSAVDRLLADRGLDPLTEPPRPGSGGAAGSDPDPSRPWVPAETREAMASFILPSRVGPDGTVEPLPPDQRWHIRLGRQLAILVLAALLSAASFWGFHVNSARPHAMPEAAPAGSTSQEEP